MKQQETSSQNRRRRKKPKPLTTVAGFGALGELRSSGSNQAVMGQLLYAQEPRGAAVRAVIGEEVMPRVLCFILDKHQVLRRRTKA